MATERFYLRVISDGIPAVWDANTLTGDWTTAQVRLENGRAALVQFLMPIPAAAQDIQPLEAPITGYTLTEDYLIHEIRVDRFNPYVIEDWGQDRSPVSTILSELGAGYLKVVLYGAKGTAVSVCLTAVFA